MSKNILEDTDTVKAINNYIDDTIAQHKELSFDSLIDNSLNTAGVEVTAVLVVLRGIIEDLTDQVHELNDRLSGTGFMMDSVKHAVLNKGLIDKIDLELAVAQVKFIGEILEQEDTRAALTEGNFDPDIVVKKAKKMAEMLLESNKTVDGQNG